MADTRKSKYDPKYESDYDAFYHHRHDPIAAQESAIRERVRAERQAKLKAAQQRANEIRRMSETYGGGKKNKYHANKCMRMVDGKPAQFDSQREAARWDELVLLQRAGKIKGLQRQVRYRLIKAQTDVNGRVIERPCDYIADFVYNEIRDGEPVEHVVEDVKSRATRTESYVIKRKLMLQKYGIRIREV